MHVRVGTGLDDDAALRVWQSALAQAGLRSGGTRAQRFRATLRSPTSLVLVAEQDEDVVGVLLAGLVGSALQLTTVAVLPARQRTGVGTALVRALLERYPRVSTSAPADVVGALERLGFVPDGAEVDGVRPLRAGGEVSR